MPSVVSDSGPLIHLAQINRLNLLEKLFGSVTVPVSVKVEAFDTGAQLGFGDAQALGNAFVDGWLKAEVVPERLAKSALKVSVGENISCADAEALLLAKKYKAEFLVDDKGVSYLAKICGLKVWNTWMLLLESLSRNLITAADLEGAVEELGKKKFRLNAKQTKEILQAAKLIENKKRARSKKTKKPKSPSTPTNSHSKYHTQKASPPQHA